MNEIDRIFDRIKSLEKNTKVDPKEIEQILIKFFKNAANIDFLTKKTTMYWGKTIIDLCLRYGYTDFLCFVVETYPKLAEIQDEEGKTFLHIAGFKGLKEVLIKALEIDPKLAKIKNLYNYTFLDEAKNNGFNVDLTKVLKTDTKITYSNNKSKSRTNKTNNKNDKKDNGELNKANDLLESLDEIEK